MRIASNGSGGLRYTLIAVVLTYLAGSLPWGFLLYDKGVTFWQMTIVGLISPIYRIQGNSNSMISMAALCVGIGAACTIAGGDAPPGIYGPFESGAGQRL
jgi:hypothetical protein